MGGRFQGNAKAIELVVGTDLLFLYPHITSAMCFLLIEGFISLKTVMLIRLGPEIGAWESRWGP